MFNVSGLTSLTPPVRPPWPVCWQSPSPANNCWRPSSPCSPRKNEGGEPGFALKGWHLLVSSQDDIFLFQLIQKKPIYIRAVPGKFLTKHWQFYENQNLQRQ